MATSARKTWSVVGTLVSAPVRGYYYPGTIKAVKQTIDASASSLPIYSVSFATPLGTMEPSEQCLVLDFAPDQIVGRGFEPITKVLLSENQKVFITHRGREVNAVVVKHSIEQDEVLLALESEPTEVTVKLSEIRLLPSRKSARVQEHPDYSLLASGRRSPPPASVANDSDHLADGHHHHSTPTSAINIHQAKVRAQQGGGRRRTTSSSSLLLSSATSSGVDSDHQYQQQPLSSSLTHQRPGNGLASARPVSARIDMPIRLVFCSKDSLNTDRGPCRLTR